MLQLSAEDIGTFVALGGTFSTHQEEAERSYRWPDLWVVPSQAIIPENEPIELPSRVEQVNPGAELTAVIGEELREADETEAWDGIKGFTVSNDVTATGDWPGWSDPDHGMITGVGYKLFPTFSPILTEFTRKRPRDHYDDLSVEVLVDGEQSVSGSTAQMAFTIPELVSFASHIVPLSENDVVALGDPGDAAITLDDADSVTCKIESVGELTNPVRRR